MSSAGDGSWVCEKCTIWNPADNTACTVCYSTRIAAKDLPYSYEWKAADRWIAYDRITCEELERAFHDESVDCTALKHGFFAGKHGYFVTFKRRSGNGTSTNSVARVLMSQSNARTGACREVRRLASDDEQLFRTIVLTASMAEAAAYGKCSVCQENFTSQDAGQDCCIVALAVCKPGHYFHRECVASWVKLKGECPFCRACV